MIARAKALLYLAFKASGKTLREACRLTEMAAIQDQREKYDAQFGYLAGKAAAFGFEVYNKNLMWMDDPLFWDIWKDSPFFKKQRPDRKYVAWSMALATLHLPGDTAECGVLDGASSYVILSARKGVGYGFHHAFDSFEGLSSPGEEDTPASRLAFDWKAGDLSVSQAVAMANLKRFGNVRYYKGWIPSRFDEVADRAFSFVHVDVDLYQPTKHALEFFYPRLSPGGILLCDDYGYHTCPGARKAFDELAAKTPEQSVIHLPTGQGFIVKHGSSLAP